MITPSITLSDDKVADKPCPAFFIGTIGTSPASFLQPTSAIDLFESGKKSGLKRVVQMSIQSKKTFGKAFYLSYRQLQLPALLAATSSMPSTLLLHRSTAPNAIKWLN